MEVLSPARALMVATLAGVAFSGIWIALAAARPSVTFHLAPIIVAAAPAVTYRLGTSRAGRPLDVAVTVGIGAGLACATLALLNGVGWLDGPAFAPFDDDVVAESLVAIAIGVVAALVVQLWPSRPAADTG